MTKYQHINKVSSYNDIVTSYNNKVSLYNNKISSYNDMVSSYNETYRRQAAMAFYNFLNEFRLFI